MSGPSPSQAMAGAAGKRARRPARPDRVVECALIDRYGVVAGMDEVGRGALAGPVSVGVAVVDSSTAQEVPEGLRDSKQLSPARRQALVEPCRAWARDSAVGHASAQEVDRWGIVGALRLAGRRALAQVAGRGHAPRVVLLDGSHDWLSTPPTDLLTDWDRGVGAGLDDGGERRGGPQPGDDAELDWQDLAVITQVKADATCAVVAAASVLAKVERDALMCALDDPGYDWAANKGYASAQHRQALARLGASDEHRRTWHLPGLRGA